MTTERTNYFLNSLTRGGFLINWYLHKTPKDKLVVTKIKMPKLKPRSERIESVVRICNSFH